MSFSIDALLGINNTIHHNAGMKDGGELKKHSIPAKCFSWKTMGTINNIVFEKEEITTKINEGKGMRCIKLFIRRFSFYAHKEF